MALWALHAVRRVADHRLACRISTAAAPSSCCRRAGLSIDYVLMALAPNLWWLALGRIIAGITSASFTTVYAYMADITPRRSSVHARTA